MPPATRPPLAYAAINQVAEGPVRLALQFLIKVLGIIRDTAVPLRGKLNPDERPTNLTQSDLGLLFYATDYDRVYRWSGTAWEDGPGQPARGMVAFFQTAPVAGWAVADGRSATMTTSTGGLVQIVTPVVVLQTTTPTNLSSGLTPYLRL